MCAQTLKGGTITASQIETLKQRLHKYLSAKNTIYMHTSPKRYMKYCNWIKKKGPFELVVDAANVYYTMDVLNRDIDLLLNKVQYFFGCKTEFFSLPKQSQKSRSVL